MIGATPLTLALAGSVHATTIQPSAQPSLNSTAIEPGAGAWKTWLLRSSGEMHLPAPPDSSYEIGAVRALTAQRDSATLDRIAHWDAGPAPYRWTEIAIDLAHVQESLPLARAARVFTHVNAAMHDALVVAWAAKYAHNRPRPPQVDPSLVPAVAVSPSPSYPCEHATAAGAASAVLAHFFPKAAGQLDALAEEAAQSRISAGVQYPSDVAAGLNLGRAVGAAAVERARADNADVKGSWTIPTEPGKWTGPAAVNADDSLWAPWLLSSGSDLRPPPPPAYDSPEMAVELAEVKDFARTPRTNALALGWQFAPYGGANHQVYWTREASRRMLEHRWDFNAPRAAQVYLLSMAAFVDTWIATQDTKFAYWGIRPNQLDPSITTVFPTPPFPSYPSNRAAFNPAVAEILAHSFPRDAETFRATAHEISESAIWAGIHFRSDLTSAQAIGLEVARLALARTT
jgi:membrane-associated phospholipid phosphatase